MNEKLKTHLSLWLLFIISLISIIEVVELDFSLSLPSTRTTQKTNNGQGFFG
jgi:hypothetical protein